MTFRVFPSLPCVVFSYSSILGLFMSLPEIFCQSNYHVVQHDSGANVTSYTGKIGFPNSYFTCY